MVRTHWLNRLPSFEVLERDFDRMLGAFFGDVAAPASGALPAVNVRDAGESWVVELALAGAKAADFEVKLEGQNLEIGSVREPHALRPDARVLRSERASGAFRRRLRLPTPVEADAVGATYEHGVLRVTLPKAREALPRTIQVQTNGGSNGRDA